MAAAAHAAEGLSLSRTKMETNETPHEPEMVRREISMADGRYLLFYTFEPAAAAGSEELSEKEEGTS